MPRLLTKRVQTQNPAGGINPSLSPNVGQYGWTSSDAAHVNQLIAYVNAAKEYAEQAKQGADFVTGKIDIITDLYNKVVTMYDKVVPLATRIEFIYRNILTIQDDVDSKYEEIILWNKEISDWVVEVRKLHSETSGFRDESATSAASASNSATEAAASAQEAKDIAEDLRKGNVYRGTWNPHTNSYPPHGGTNSTWDVILDEGETEYKWNNITWFWGDRLIYLLVENKYQQVESGTTVTSVNGKKGAVVLTPEDVGALDKNGVSVSTKKLETPHLIAGKPFDGTQDVPISPLDIGAVDSGRTINGKPLTSDIALDYSDVGAVPPIRKVNNKPLSGDIELTATDVGAVGTNQLISMSGGETEWSAFINKVPVINNAGLTELGRYIDMREGGADVDYSWRFDAGGKDDNTFSLYSKTGTPVFKVDTFGNGKFDHNSLSCTHRFRVTAPSSPMIELHNFGKHAYAQYVTDGGEWRFVRTDGSGGETRHHFSSFNNGDFLVVGKMRAVSPGNCGWGDVGRGAFDVNDAITLASGNLTKVFSYRVNNPSVWTLDNSLVSYQDQGTNDAGRMFQGFVSTDGGSYTRIWRFYNSGSLESPSGWYIHTDGNVNGAVWESGYLSHWIQKYFAPISDSRLKRNIQESTKSALDDVSQIKFHSYEWVDDGITKDHKPTELGILAQEMEAINPAYTKDIKTFKEDGSVATSLKSLDVTNMLALALKANQELLERIEALEAKVASL